MSNVDGVDIEKSENGVVLVNFCTGDFARDDFAEEAGFHIFIVA